MKRSLQVAAIPICAVAVYLLLRHAACSPREILALEGDTTWGAETTTVSARVLVPADTTLTVRPGATVRFAPRCGLIVRGRLVAEGTQENPILFTRAEDTAIPWGGLVFHPGGFGVIRHARVTHAGTFGSYLTVEGASLTLQNVDFSGAHKRVIMARDSSALIEGCAFPAVDENEVITAHRIPEGGAFVVTNCLFLPNRGYNDIIDFSECARPGPVPLFTRNLFLGGADDGLDLDGCDATVTDNVFIGFRRTGHPNPANAISLSQSSRVVAVNNVFANNDHGVVSRGTSLITLTSNSFYRNTVGIAFTEKGHPPGAARIAHALFERNEATFAFDEQATELGVSYSCLPEAERFPNAGNVASGPHLADPEAGDFGVIQPSTSAGMGAVHPPLPEICIPYLRTSPRERD